MRILVGLILGIFAQLAGASANEKGLCLAVEGNNPGYQAFCGRFTGYNGDMCRQLNQFCAWQPEGRTAKNPPGYCLPNCPIK